MFRRSINRAHNSRRQQGFLLPLSLFIVLGAASLAIAISQMAAGSRSSAVLATLNRQALYAADGGVQMAMSRLYYGVTTKAQADANCVAVDGSSLAYSGTGLALCSTDVNCSVSVSGDGAVSLYTINSVSACGSGEYQTGRRLQIEAYMQNQ